MGNHLKILIKYLFFFGFLLNSVFVSANNPNQKSADPILGGLRSYIPLFFRGDIASDLEYKAKHRSPDYLYKKWKNKEIIDLSLLNPVVKYQGPERVYSLGDWSNHFPKDFQELEIIDYGESFEYLSYGGKSVDQFMLNVMDSQGRLVNLNIGPRAINTLMKRALLYKIGYQVFPMYSPMSSTIKFRDYLDKRRFFKNLNDDFGCKNESEEEDCSHGGVKNFLVKGKLTEKEKNDVLDSIDRYRGFFDESLFDLSNSLRVKNAVVMPPPTEKQNLSLTISPDSIGGKRKYAALVIPYALVDLPESINLFSYNIGSLIDKKLILDFYNAKKFSTNFEDSRWISRRIANLNENDFYEIAAETNFEQCLVLQLAEILKSRRNDLLRKLSLDKEYPELDVNTKLNCGADVVDGVLTKKRYEGYGNQFSHDRYEGPLVGSEIWALVKSISFSNIIFNAMTRINDKLPGTDIAGEVYQHKLDLSAKQYAHYIATKETLSTPFESYRIPYTNFGLMYSRDIVAGPYLGTSNAVQMVENIGFQVGIGNYFGWDGLRSRDFLSANLGLSYQLSITHIQPIQIKVPKKEGAKTDTKGAFEEAASKQMSGLFNIFSFPFDAFRDYKNYEAQDVDVEELLPSPVKALIISLDTMPVIQADLRRLYHSLNYKVDESAIKETRKTLNSKLSQVRKNWKSLKDIYAKNLTKLDPKAKVKKWNPIRLSGFVNSGLEALSKSIQRIKSRSFDDVVESFLNEFKVGDSVIAHHNYDINAGVNAGYALTTKGAWFLDLSAGKKKLFRTHINRIDKKTFQVYRSIADKSALGFIAGLRVYFRFMYYGYNYSFGEVNSRMYSVNIEQKAPKESSLSPKNKKVVKSYLNDSKIVEKMEALKYLLFTGSVEKLKSIRKPIRIKHKFEEHRSSYGLLFWKGEAVQNFHRMDITDLDGEETSLIKYTDGKRFGGAYQDFVIDYANVYIKEHSSKDIKLNIAGNSDPGKSFFGYSKYKEGSIEALVPKQGLELEEQCLSINFRWNQFIASPEELHQELVNYKQKFGLDLTRMEALQRTERIDIFSFNTTYNLYADALSHIARIKESELESLIANHLIVPERSGFKMRCKSVVYKRQKRYSELVDTCHEKSIIKSFLYKFKSMKETLAYEEYKAYMKSMTDFVLFSERYLSPTGFHKLVGGEDNVFLLSNVSGYRKGDENNSRDGILTFDSFGRAPGAFNMCPVQAMASQLNLQQSELLLYWLNSRL